MFIFQFNFTIIFDEQFGIELDKKMQTFESDCTVCMPACVDLLKLYTNTDKHLHGRYYQTAT